MGVINAMTDGIKLAVPGQIKRLPDPQGLMNPGKLFSA
jgi:FAD/FMN-containing dehydrogenase